MIDLPTLAYARRFRSDIIGVINAPFSKGRRHFNATQYLLKTGESLYVFAVKPVYYEALDGKMRPLSEVTVHHGNRHISLTPDWMQKMSIRYFLWLQKRQNLIGTLAIDYGQFAFGLQPHHLEFATTTTAFPDPDPETTTVDGYTRTVNTGTFAALVAAGGTSADPTNNDVPIHIRSTATSNQWDLCDRIHALFDSSAVPDTDVISATTCSFKQNTANTDPLVLSLNIYTTNPASNTNLVASDHQTVANTAQATAIAQSALSTTLYNDFNFNSTGMGNVSKTSISKFSLRYTCDADNSAPTWSASQTNVWTIFTAETAATTSDPKLVVTSAPAAANPSVVSDIIFFN